MEALKLQPSEFHFNNIQDILDELRKRYTNEYTFTRFCDFRDWIIDNERQVIDMISKLTLPQLKKRVPYDSRDRKPDLVERLHESLLYSFNSGAKDTAEMVEVTNMSYFDYKERERAKLLAVIKAVTLEEYEKARAKEQGKIAARNKALANPETKDEFKTYMGNAIKSLTPEQLEAYRLKPTPLDTYLLTSKQLEAYDKIIADERREERKKQNTKHKVIGGVELGDAQMEIVKSYHAKKRIDIWVVRLDQWIRPSQFEKLREKAYSFGSYYSTYKQEGAIPGFIFQSEETARQFTQLQEGDVDISNIYEERELQRLENRVQSLREKATTLIEMGEEAYNRERKTNTLRRARMASSAEAAAARKIIMGKILFAIAEKQEDGTIDYLDKLSFISDLETLEMLTSQAKWRMISEKNAYRDEEAQTLSTEWANYIKFPFPVVHITEDTIQTVREAQYTKGKMLAAGRFLKRFAACTDGVCYCKSEQAVEDFARIFVTDDPHCRYYSQLRIFNRIVRMNLLSLAELRSAIRELIRVKLTISLTPEQQLQMRLRELERSFVCRNIPGFFPTPAELAMKLVALANIQPGDTIMEPSAGLGHIADAITELHPDNTLLLCEINSSLAEALEVKGYTVRHDDFLNVSQFGASPDRIIMNPPFEDLQDIDHVYHAFHLLNTGGRLVAIMANNKYRKEEEVCKTQRDHKIRQFLDFVDTHGYIEGNPEGSFLSAFRPTGVSTITVVLDK
jgi:hypothetical protein